MRFKETCYLCHKVSFSWCDDIITFLQIDQKKSLCDNHLQSDDSSYVKVEKLRNNQTPV